MNFPESSSNFVGIKFQSYMATYDLIKNCNSNKTVHHSQTYFGLEIVDDNIKRDFVNGTLTIGQAKHYSSDLNINSEAVKNTLNNFYTIFLTYNGSEAISFHFFSTAGFKQESKSKILPQEDIDTLVSDDISILEIFKTNSYNEYTKLITDMMRKLLDISDISDATIIKFLESIDWSFNEDSPQIIREKTIELIKQSEHFHDDLEGKEELLFDHLIETFESSVIPESKLYKSDFSCSDLELAFLKFKGNEYRRFAPSSGILTEIDLASKKTLEEKIYDVNPSFNRQLIAAYNTHITRIKSEHSQFLPQEVNPFKEFVYSICFEYMHEKYSSVTKDFYSEASIKKIFDDLFKHVLVEFEDKSTDVRYAFSSKDSLKQTIKILFDECYLDFIRVGDDVENG